METNNIHNLHPFTLSSSFVRGETSAPTSFNSYQNPRKKRTKFTRTDTIHGAAAAAISKPKTSRRPDPTAPKITRPCSECGKKFWSWKALFGHMRCHPERQWRGINPPPNLRRHEADSGALEDDSSSITEEDHEVATCLLMLANGVPVPPTASDHSPSVTVNQGTAEYSDIDHGVGSSYSGGNLNSCGRFECSSCKKVFGSHQALGGHRASHKNVKGCYAITKNDGDEDHGCCLGLDMNTMMFNGHKCSICLRVFPSGQALGGHMRCHWEKVAEDQYPSRVSAIDLNLAVQDHDDDDASSSPALDLRLGL